MQGIVILVLLAALFAPCIALAQTESSRHPYFTNKHSISVGATRQTADSEVRSSVPYLPELSLSLDDLGVDKRDNSWMAEYRWRFKPKWGLVVAGYQFDNDGSLEVSKDFNFDGVEFEAGARVDTDLKVGTYIVDLMYQVYQSEKVEMMLGGGLHMINFDMKVKSSVFTDERDFTIQQGASDLLVPLPNIRFQGFYAITDKWALGLTAGWLERATVAKHCDCTSRAVE
jgi:hypothetical protein